MEVCIGNGKRRIKGKTEQSIGLNKVNIKYLFYIRDSCNFYLIVNYKIVTLWRKIVAEQYLKCSSSQS